MIISSPEESTLICSRFESIGIQIGAGIFTPSKVKLVYTVGPAEKCSKRFTVRGEVIEIAPPPAKCGKEIDCPTLTVRAIFIFEP